MLASSRIQLLCALLHRGLILGASFSVRSGVYLRLNNSTPSSTSSSSTTRFCRTRRFERWPNVSVELDVGTRRPNTVAMAGREVEGGGTRRSFGGPGTPANSSGGVAGGFQRDLHPYSRQQSGTSSHSEYEREGSNRFTSSWQQRAGGGNYNAGQGRSGHEDESGSRAGRRRSMDKIEALGRCMTGILRHQAANYNLEIKNDGYVLVSDLLKQSKKTAAGFALSSHTEDDVRKAVKDDSKKRFGLKEENGDLYIRAHQGHTIKSVESEHLLSSITAPSEAPVCVHGTSKKAWEVIEEGGLSRMTRNHIHFATGLPKEDGVISGMRVTSEILIYLNVEKALKDGMKLYISDNKVVLTEGLGGVISPEYFKEVRQADGTPIELKVPHTESVANVAAEPEVIHVEPQRKLIKKIPKNLDCVFCTNVKEMTTLWEEGLKVSKDKFIHFVTAMPMEESNIRGAGNKVTNPVFIHLNVVKAFEDEMKLYRQDNEVVTEGIDGVISSDYFKKVCEKRPNSQIPIPLCRPHGK